jgi:HD-GYP domain-containing protein (c-di-GMP phosphodiesterase class II)
MSTEPRVYLLASGGCENCPAILPDYQIAMLKRVKTEDVRLGMFLHKLEGAWLSHPFWKRKFLIEDPDQLAELKSSAVEWVHIDVSKGDDVAAQPASVPARAPSIARRMQVLDRARQSHDERVNAPAIRSGTPAFDPLSTTPRSYAAEMHAATDLARRSTRMMQAVFAQARLGKTVKIATLAPMIDEINASIQRNPHAFSGITRLKKLNEYLYLHALSVSALMINLALQLKLSPDQTREAGLAGLLMDVGMGHVPQEIYDKDAALTPNEARIVHNHTSLAEQFLTLGGEMPEAVLDVCLHHHERLDGSGYPHGLAGDQLSLFVRMAGICDTYDAMTSRRPHKPGGDPSTALVKMQAMADRYDPEILDAFIRGVGIYPIGSLVRLKSERLAVVYDQNPIDLTLPRVRAFYAIGERGFIRPEDIDLSQTGGTEAITGIEAPEDWDIADWETLSARLVEKANAARG